MGNVSSKAGWRRGFTAVFPNSQGAGTDGHAAGGRRELRPGVSKDKTALMPRMAEQKDAHWAKLFMENNTGQRWFPLPLLSPAAPAGAKAAAGDAPALARLAGSPGRRRHHMPFHQRRVQQRSVQFGR